MTRAEAENLYIECVNCFYKDNGASCATCARRAEIEEAERIVHQPNPEINE